MTTILKNDIPDTCACVPYGTIEVATRYRKHAKRATHMRKLPVLAGYFSSAKLLLDANAPRNIGFGSIDTEGQLPMLSIRLQVGANMLYWLANAGDPAIWAMVDAWHKAGRLALAAEFDDGRVVLVESPFKSGPKFRALERAGANNRQKATKEFMESAGDTLISGELVRMATSDIPGIFSLQSVQGCTVRTKHTGRILVSLEVAASSSCDLLIPESWARHVPPRQTVH